MTRRPAMEPVESSPVNPTGQALDWRQCWYPVTFVQDLPAGRPHAFTIYDNRFVLFRGVSGELCCLQDRCPHRAARLSDGRVVAEGIECLYHGWRFGAGGRCQHIPQMVPGTAPPTRARVPSFVVAERQGLVWVWPAREVPADETSLPVVPELDRTGVASIDYMIDLPYDQSYLIENVIDIAHIHVAHDGVRGGGRREHTRPLSFEVIEESVAGIRATFRSQGLGSEVLAHELQAATVDFIAPNLIKYGSGYRDRHLLSGLALYSLPSGRRRCRLMYRAYSNFWNWRDRLRPRWLEHHNQTILLEQDMQVVIGQVETIEQSGDSLMKLWLPIKTSDVLVLKYRQWLDRFGKGLPTYRGYTSSSPPVDGASHSAVSRGRFAQHTQICASCSKAYERLELLKQALLTTALVGGGLAVLSSETWLAGSWLAASGLSLLGRYSLGRLEAVFR